MRREFANFMTDIVERDSTVVLLVGDIGYSIFDDFRDRFPERFFNFGLCEQSLIGASSGMALEGLKPYVYTITPFLIERAFEQVKLDIDQQNVNVKLVGYADYPEHGPTHAEVKGLVELLNNIMCYTPKDSTETREALVESYGLEIPTFISLKRSVCNGD